MKFREIERIIFLTAGNLKMQGVHTFTISTPKNRARLRFLITPETLTPELSDQY